MNSQLPLAVRATAAALAVFMTVATLNCVISAAESQQGQLMAQAATRQAAPLDARPSRAVIVALAPRGTAHH